MNPCPFSESGLEFFILSPDPDQDQPNIGIQPGKFGSGSMKQTPKNSKKFNPKLHISVQKNKGHCPQTFKIYI